MNYQIYAQYTTKRKNVIRKKPGRVNFNKPILPQTLNA